MPSINSAAQELFANAKNAAAWLARLKEADLATARASLLEALTAFVKSPEPIGVDGINALALVDDQSAPILGDTLLGYLRNPGMSKSLVNALCAEMEGIFRSFGDAYYKFITAQALQDFNQARSNLVALVASRGIRAYANVSKWNAFRLEPLPHAIWKSLHELYRRAEALGVEKKGIILFSTPREMTATPAQMYSQALLLGTLANGAFSPRQIESADEWLSAWCVGMELEPGFDAQRHIYCVDLAAGTGARRVAANQQGAELRFLSTDGLALQIERTKIAFRQGQVTPSNGIDPITRAGEYAELLDKIDRIWSPEWVRSDQRSHRRVSAGNEVVQAVRSLDAVCGAATEDYEVEHGEQTPGDLISKEEEFDLKMYGFVREQTRAKIAAQQPVGHKTPRESWHLVDESINGYGMLLDDALDNDLKLGALLGLKRQKSNRWAAGYVTRKLARKDAHQQFLGVEILSHTPVIVVLNDVDAPEEPTGLSSETPAHALFVPGDQGRGRADSLIIDSAAYTANKDFLLSARNVSYYIRMTRVIRKGLSWQRIAFEVLGKKT